MDHEDGIPEAFDRLPDVRDGLTRRERVVLYVLYKTQKERGDRNVPTAMLWGRVCEYFWISPEELSAMLARLGARRGYLPTRGLSASAVSIAAHRPAWWPPPPRYL